MRPSVVLGFLLFATDPVLAQQEAPANGWLVIHGGGEISNEVLERFKALAGGPKANVVMIPTAINGDPDTLDKHEKELAKRWGIGNFAVVHTRDRVRANSDGFVEPLRHATAVWIDGGRQWRLADAYLGTAVEREIKVLLSRGGVVFGSSAGASIQASFLVRGEPGTPTNPDGDNTIMVSPGHETGFGLLANSAIDQHVNARGREKDLDAVISQHPELLGIGIDAGVAIIVHGDFFEVVGGQVAIHDGKNHDGAGYYFLSPGQMFNLKTRAVGKATELPSRISQCPAVTTGESQTSKYPLTLTVIRATRFNRGGYWETEIIGAVSDDPAQKLHMTCDVGIFSIGPDGRLGNKYPARRTDKSHEIKIATREQGSDKIREHTCKH